MGTGTGEISVVGSTVSYEGTAIATINVGSDGTNGSDLVLTLNSAATPLAVEALIENLTYGNSNLTDPTPSRTLAIAINDRRNTSAAQQIEVVINNTLPDISISSGGLVFDGSTTPVALDPVAFGETFERSLSISNRGNDTLNLGGVTVPEGFRLRRTNGEEIISGPLTDSLEAGQSLELVLERTDFQVASFTGDLSFTSNDPDQPNFVIPLTGTITFAAQAPLEIDFTLTRLSLPPIELGANSVRLGDSDRYFRSQGGDIDESIVGNEQSNVLLGLRGNDNIVGLGGNDVLRGDSGDDQLEGGDGSDRILGGGGSDRILGGDGNDLVRGGSDDDLIDGGSGNDFLLGDGGNDFIDGADGDDVLRGGNGVDSLGGGLDNDLLLGEGGADLLAGEDGDDFLLGGGGNDQLDGGFGNDTLSGELGDDVLFGNDGADTLLGGDGADLLDGGNGLDSLTGGLGADTFAVDIDLLATTSAEFDVITDFEDGVDLIAITGLASVDSFTWSDGTNGLEIFVNNTKIFQLNGISRSAISPADFVT
ncbi:MAG: calcium-binding protein [Cyanobacteria bacterium P01_F01_bin.153]